MFALQASEGCVGVVIDYNSPLVLLDVCPVSGDEYWDHPSIDPPLTYEDVQRELAEDALEAFMQQV